MDFIHWIIEGKRFFLGAIPILVFGYLLWYVFFESQGEDHEEE